MVPDCGSLRSGGFGVACVLIAQWVSADQSFAQSSCAYVQGSGITGLQGQAGANSFACGLGASAVGQQATSLGRSASASGNDSVAIGYISNASGFQGIAIGASSVAA